MVALRWRCRLVARESTIATFADTLAALRETIKRSDGKRYSLEDLAASVRSYTGASCSKQYIKDLLDGKYTNPSGRFIDALAHHFRVPIEIFFNSTQREEILTDLRIAAALRDAGVQEVQLRALLDMAPDNRAKVLTFIGEIARREAAAHARDRAEQPDEPGHPGTRSP